MTSGQDQLLIIILTALSVIFIPLLVVVIRGIVKWTRVEDKLDELIKDMATLVREKDETHRAMIQTMTDDRKATDKRLRWLEENIWNRGTHTTRNV